MSAPRVRTILCESKLADGQLLRIVELLDTRVALDLGGTILTDAIWDARKLDDCVDAFLSRKRELGQSGGDGGAGAAQPA